MLAAVDISIAGPVGALVVVAGYLLSALAKANRRVDTSTEARIAELKDRLADLEAELARCRELRGEEATAAASRIRELEAQIKDLQDQLGSLYERIEGLT